MEQAETEIIPATDYSLKTVQVIDARMGRGKTTAAINYMLANRGTKRFVYITPFLTEVSRVCEACDFDHPDNDSRLTKLTELKKLLHYERNIAATHALFYLLDNEATELIKEKKYSIIIDESIAPLSKISMSKKDLDTIAPKIEIDGNGIVKWIEEDYEGRFDDIMLMAQANSLVCAGGFLMNIMNPDLLAAFDEIYMLTYLFNGQIQKGYLDYFGFNYKIRGVKYVNGQLTFSDEPDSPPPMSLSSLIYLVNEDKLNDIGKARTALSVSWYGQHGKSSMEIKHLRNNLYTYFRRRCILDVNRQLWTCPKESMKKLLGSDGRFKSSFLQMSARATNEFKDRDQVAYLVNRFLDPNYKNFLMQRDVAIDDDLYALGEMLQFIWRSAIRDGKPITLYIPSKRMRTLFTDWLNEVSKGGESA